MGQDVFMKVWEKRKELNASYIKPLLYKMAGDRLISDYRKQTSHLNFVQHMVVEDTPVSPIEQLQYEERLNEIMKKQREVFLMNRNEDLKYQEIAEQLHISIKPVGVIKQP